MEKGIMMLTIAQMYILHILRNKKCSLDEIFPRIEKAKSPPFSIHKKMMYHHIDLLGKKGFIHVEKSRTLPPRLTINITDAGLQQLDSIYAFIKENTPDPIPQNLQGQHTFQINNKKHNQNIQKEV